MFSDCSSLTDLDIRKFNTTNVKNMAFMFTNCSRLAKLDLKNFNTKNVTNMEYMFSGCTSLKELKFGDNFNTTSVEKMNYMFYKCVKLSEEFKKNILAFYSFYLTIKYCGSKKVCILRFILYPCNKFSGRG